MRICCGGREEEGRGKRVSFQVRGCAKGEGDNENSQSCNSLQRSSTHHTLKARVQVRHPKVENLRQVVPQLLVDDLVNLLCVVGLLLCEGKLGSVGGWLLAELAGLGTGGVVVEELEGGRRKGRQ